MKNNRFLKTLTKKILVSDGAMGTLLQQRGLKTGQAPEELNITAPHIVESVHADYVNAGSDVVLTNTFGATRSKLSDYHLAHKIDAINFEAVKIARNAVKKTRGFVACDIGPLGSYLKPLGPLSWDAAYDLFAEQARILSTANPDLFIIETMSDIREVKAALRAAKDCFDGPVFVQMTFTEDGTTVTGTDPLSFITVAEAMGADGIGINCSVGPKNLYPLVKILAQHTHLPISVKPNRGMPQLINRETIYPGTIQEFVTYAQKFARLGVNLIGGCCGTDPSFITAIAQKLNKQKPKIRKKKINITRFCSRTKTLTITHKSPLIKIGERINPTGRNILQKELADFNFTTVRNDAVAQVSAGAHMLDVNMGLPGGNEQKLMKKALDIVQSSVQVPMCIDSNSPEVLETALKLCEGKPLVNSVTGETHKLNAILPLIKRYGAGIIGLTIDEKGIPSTAAKRMQIAQKILHSALKNGINREDIFIDNLSLTASSEADQAQETLTSIKLVRSKLKLNTILGISNISFGLPNRSALNSTFLNLARSKGLTSAIMNPLVPWGKNDKYALAVFNLHDTNCTRYINKYAGITSTAASKKTATITDIKSIHQKLYSAVLYGVQESIYALIDSALLDHIEPREITNGILLPALEEVGEKFVRKQYFLPQVLMCADTIQKAFLYIQSKFPQQITESKGTILLATVKGDIHDIGKNIVKTVFENHGWQVVDLGKNVDAQKIIDTAIEIQPEIIGLSALMTTTMIHMEDVIKLKNLEHIPSKIIVGGAAVTARFADSIQADGYAPDAVQAVRLANQLIHP
ncbi:MAG: homocysteine S-methyltransferase family protein [bacterium]